MKEIELEFNPPPTTTTKNKLQCLKLHKDEWMNVHKKDTPHMFFLDWMHLGINGFVDGYSLKENNETIWITAHGNKYNLRLKKFIR